MTSYKSIQALSKDTHRAAEGTLALVAEKGGELYLKAHNGWRKVQVWQLFQAGARVLFRRSALTHSVFFQLGELISPGPPPSAASQSLSRSGDWSRSQRLQSQVQTPPTKAPNVCYIRTLAIGTKQTAPSTSGETGAGFTCACPCGAHLKKTVDPQRFRFANVCFSI